MKKSLLFYIIILSCCSAVAADDTENILRDAVKNVGGALAMVRCDIQEETGTRSQAGIGICIEGSGMLVTTAIDPRVAVEKISRIQVILPGNTPRTLDAKLLGIDPGTGLSFVRVSGHSWSVVTFQKNSNLALGQKVVSIGLRLTDPALPTTLGMGYIAGKQRVPGWLFSVTGGSLSEIGSVVLNAQGRAIGLIADQPFLRHQTLGRRGPSSLALRCQDRATSFMPVESFVHILTDIPQDGRKRSLPWIGVGRFSPVTESLAEAQKLKCPAIMIDQVIPGDAAEKAGLKNRDLIVAVDGKPLEPLASPQLIAQNFNRQLMQKTVGQEISLTVLSGNQRRTVRLKLARMPTLPSEAPRLFDKSLGLLLREKVMLDRYTTNSLAAETSGLLVLAVAQRSPAYNAGLQQGDILSSINGRGIRTVKECSEIIKQALSFKPPRDLTVIVQRGSGQEKLVIRPPVE